MDQESIHAFKIGFKSAFRNLKSAILLCTLLLALCTPAETQPAEKMARIGYLSAHSGPPLTLVAFKEGLREIGWIEGKQIEIEYRYAGGNLDKLY